MSCDVIVPAMAPPTSPEREVDTDIDLKDDTFGLRFDSSHTHFATSPSLEVETLSDDHNRNQDGGLQRHGQSTGRWTLWHNFMKEHAHLDAWLQLAEEAVTSWRSVHVSYQAAKAELTKYERLRREAGSQLVQLDNLSQRNRTLTRLFSGAMKARLLAAVRESSLRWDDVNAKLTSITVCLQLFVSEWEEFEAQREQFALWLADLEVSLSEVENLQIDTCDKLRHLQSFQQCVCVNSGQVSAILRRGEALIQRSDPEDAEHLERHLVELLRRCSLLHNNIAHTHTRLLSMRLVFEEDWFFSQPSDSGCPSETLQDEEGALDKPQLDVSPVSNRPRNFTQRFNSVPSSPPRHAPPSPTHDHLGLEWDPSVDIGRPVSRGDADSSYFSVSTGLKRRSYFAYSNSQSNLSNDIIDHDGELLTGNHADEGHAPCCFLSTNEDAGPSIRWTTSTPEPGGFDSGRVEAWLGEQSSAPCSRRTSCSKAVQTDDESLSTRYRNETANQLLPASAHHTLDSGLSALHDLDLKTSSDWSRSHAGVQDEEELTVFQSAARLPTEQSAINWFPPALSSFLLLLALLAFAFWFAFETPCHHGSRLSPNVHLTLRYVKGPPPT